MYLVASSNPRAAPVATAAAGAGAAGERQRGVEARQGEERRALIVAGRDREDGEDVVDPGVGDRREGGAPAREAQPAGDRRHRQKGEDGEEDLRPARRHVAVAEGRDQHPGRHLRQDRVEGRARIPHREADHPQVPIADPGGDRRQVVRNIVETVSTRRRPAQPPHVVEAHQGDRQSRHDQQGEVDPLDAFYGRGRGRRGGGARPPPPLSPDGAAIARAGTPPPSRSGTAPAAASRNVRAMSRAPPRPPPRT